MRYARFINRKLAPVRGRETNLEDIPVSLTNTYSVMIALPAS